MSTFNRLKEKQPTVVLKWFQGGQLWSSRLDARDAARKRSEQGHKDWPREERGASAKPVWQPKDPSAKPRAARPDWKPASADARPKPFGAKSDRPDWRPKGESARPKPFEARSNRPDWQPKGAAAKSHGDRPDWRPKGEGAKPRGSEPGWRPKSDSARPKPFGACPARTEWRSKGAGAKPRGDRAEWKPKGTSAPHGSERPAWRPKSAASGSAASVPKFSTDAGDDRQWDKPASAERPAPPASGSERRDSKWRPGGDHKDPRQKYKDAKKAKWTRVKQVIRARGAKRKP